MGFRAYLWPSYSQFMLRSKFVQTQNSPIYKSISNKFFHYYPLWKKAVFVPLNINHISFVLFSKAWDLHLFAEGLYLKEILFSFAFSRFHFPNCFIRISATEIFTCWSRGFPLTRMNPLGQYAPAETVGLKFKWKSFQFF